MSRQFVMHKARKAAASPAPAKAATPPAKHRRDFAAEAAAASGAKEVGGPSGPEPTRYGDWERKGICYDF